MSDSSKTFPPFSLPRLLKTVFGDKTGERVAILIDLDNPEDIKDFGYLNNPDYTIQRYAYDIFYQGFKDGVLDELGWTGGDMFAYEITGGSNLDLPDAVYNVAGEQLSFEKDIYPNYDILLCISTYSATAPLTAFAKQYGFRGATMHGLNQIILESGLAADYNEVSRTTEALRQGMSNAEAVEFDFVVEGMKATLRLELGGQEAQKSHGLCPPGIPDIANLPAGEVYYIPTRDTHGDFPFKYDDGTLAMMHVENARIQRVSLIKGDQKMVDDHLALMESDPAVGDLGELGFGTQEYPVCGRDIQDEKALGTFHIATGRSDHLGGDITPDKFNDPKNASHDDILYAPHKTPEIQAPQVRMYRDGQEIVLIENYKPAKFMQDLLQ